MSRVWIIKVSILPILIYINHVIQINIPATLLFAEIDIPTLKLMWKGKGAGITKAIYGRLEEKEQLWKTHPYQF